MSAALGDSQPEPSAGFIIENQVTHARLFPKASAHAFTYPTLAFFVSLGSLESHSLDLARGWLFGYGGISWRVTGIRSRAYLAHDDKQPQSIRMKLQQLLEQYGHDCTRLGDVWMLTMPSYLGYECINPLTVHYCYTKGAEPALAWVVLEIHNTFGEKHVHVLEPGEDEDKDCPAGYHHQWTFARDFHVSPFNDRQGYYSVAISTPPPPGSSTMPRPKVRIHLHTPGPEASIGPLKLTASLSARHTVALTSANLVRALMRQPFVLLLSFVRILYHAWILHYVKLLDVFPRPDPKPPMRTWSDLQAHEGPAVKGSNEGGQDEDSRPARMYGGIGWQDEGPLEAYARRTTYTFLARRVTDLGMAVTLVAGDPSVPKQIFAPPSSMQGHTYGEELVIHYTTPRFFSTLLLAPSAAHMLQLGWTEDLFRVNSEALFSQLFVASTSSVPGMGKGASSAQRLRIALLPKRFVAAEGSVPMQHPLDSDGSVLVNGLVVRLVHLADRFEKGVFALVGARFVPGTEPWGRWERAAGGTRRE